MLDLAVFVEAAAEVGGVERGANSVSCRTSSTCCSFSKDGLRDSGLKYNNHYYALRAPGVSKKSTHGGMATRPAPEVDAP